MIVGADADVGICSNEGRTLGSQGRPCGLGQVIAAALSAVKTKLVFARNREFEGRCLTSCSSGQSAFLRSPVLAGFTLDVRVIYIL